MEFNNVLELQNYVIINELEIYGSDIERKTFYIRNTETKDNKKIFTLK